MTRLPFAAVPVLLLLAAPAAAQDWDVSVDCTGTWQPLDRVPYQVRFEEQAFQSHQIQVRLEVDPPGMAPIVLFEGVLTLNANQDRAFQRELKLPAIAPAGSYSMDVYAQDEGMAMTDSCSFDVI